MVVYGRYLYEVVAEGARVVKRARYTTFTTLEDPVPDLEIKVVVWYVDERFALTEVKLDLRDGFVKRGPLGL